MVRPSSTEANDTYTCILLKLMSYLGLKDVTSDFSFFYNDLLNILQFSCNEHFMFLNLPWYYH